MPSFFDWLLGNSELLRVEDELADQERQRFQAVQKALDGPHGDNATLYAATANLFEGAKFPDPTTFAKRLGLRFIERCEERLPIPHFDVGIQMAATAASLYAAERLNDLPPNPALYSSYGDNAALGAMRDLLLRHQRKAAFPLATLDALSAPIIASFLAITRRLPPMAQGNPTGDMRAEDTTSIPLIDLLQDVGAIVEEALEPFAAPEAKDIGLFRWLHERLKLNAAAIAEKSRSNRPIRPSEYDGSSAEIVSAYLKGTPFERIFFDGCVPFSISVAKRLEHTAIIAGSGWGKTQLLQSIIVEDLESPDPPSIVVIDSTNRMIERLQHLSLFNNRLKDRIVIIDPERSPAAALNMFDINTPRMQGYTSDMRERVETDIIALFSYVFSSIQNPLTDPMRTAFSYMVRLLITMPDANITKLRNLLEENPKGGYEASDFKKYIEKLDPTARDFFKHQFFSDRAAPTRASILQRLSSVISVPAFERMFSTVNKVDFFEEMQRGSCILVNTSEASLKDASVIFGRYIIARVMAAAFERASLPDEKRKPTFLIVDEAAPYFDDQFEKLLTRVRQFKLGIVIAFQHLEQASEKIRSAIASNTTVKYAGGLGYTDRRWLAREMETTPEFIGSLKKDIAEPPQFTNYACQVRGMDRAIKLHVPFYTLENMTRMTAAEHAQLLERNRLRTAYVTPVPPLTEPTPRPAEPVPQSQAAMTTTKVPRSQSVPAAVDPHTGDHTKPASKWGEQ